MTPALSEKAERVFDLQGQLSKARYDYAHALLPECAEHIACQYLIRHLADALAHVDSSVGVLLEDAGQPTEEEVEAVRRWATLCHRGEFPWKGDDHVINFLPAPYFLEMLNDA